MCNLLTTLKVTKFRFSLDIESVLLGGRNSLRLLIKLLHIRQGHRLHMEGIKIEISVNLGPINSSCFFNLLISGFIKMYFTFEFLLHYFSQRRKQLILGIQAEILSLNDKSFGRGVLNFNRPCF